MDQRTRDLLRLRQIAGQKADVQTSRMRMADKHEAMEMLLDEEAIILERLNPS